MNALRAADPSIMSLRLSALLNLYRWRLRHHVVQELLAGAGIAIGVALCFGVLVANTSIVGSARQLIDGVTGAAELQLGARSPAGMPESVARRAERLPGVWHAASLLRVDATVVGPRGRASVQLVGVTPSLIGLHSAATSDFSAESRLLSGGIGLPAGVAASIGVHARGAARLLIAGSDRHTTVSTVLDSKMVGAVAEGPVAIAAMPFAQRLSGEDARVSEVLIEARPGRKRAVAAELRDLAGGRLEVAPANEEVALLANASKPNDQSTRLFAAISAMVGFLLALNAVLLTVPERRRFVAELRTQGFGPRQVLLVLGFQALLLGLVGSLVGVCVGELLARSLFDQVPRVLTFAFPLDSHQTIPIAVVLLAVGCGIVAAIAASMPPALDRRRGRPLDAVLREAGEAGHRVSERSVWLLGLAGAVIVASVSAIVLLAPSLTVLGGVLLALASVCLVLPAFVLAVRALVPLSQRIRGSMLALAVIELRATATRSVALAGVAALAVYGSIAILGAREDLIRGLNDAVTEYLSTAEVWVSTSDNTLNVDGFRSHDALPRIRSAPGVASARPYWGALLDMRGERMWVRARSAGAPRLLEASQIVEGDLARATAELRGGGWATVSSGFAATRRLKVGSPFTLPTPSGPERLRVAAVTTNIGWTPGALTLSAADFRRWWPGARPTAYEVDLRSGVSEEAGRSAVRRALADPALLVQTLSQREAVYMRSARQGLQTLGEISTLLLITAALAVAAALSAAIWLRRSWFASLKTKGFSSRQLLRTLLWESAIVLVIGCAVGTVLGVYGHALASRWLERTTGFPAPFAFGEQQVLVVLSLVAAIALAIVALPGMRAASVPPQATFQE